MSYRFDSPLISNAYHFGNRGLGLKGSEIASAGTHGAGYIYDDLVLPADANKEYSGFVETPPGVGTFFAYEDSSFTYVGPSASFVYRLREDGVDKGTATVQLTAGVGANNVWTEADDIHSVSATLTLTTSGAMSWAEESDTSSGQISLRVTGTASYTEEDDLTSIASTVLGLITSSITSTEQDDAFVITADVAGLMSAQLSYTEADDICSVASELRINSTVSFTDVDDVNLTTVSLTSNNISIGITWADSDDISSITVASLPVATIGWTDANDISSISVSIPVQDPPLPVNLVVKFHNPKYKITFRKG